MAELEGTRERLTREDANYRRLAHKHEEYERRLADLRSRKFLSEDEKLEEINLKKLKLRVKDEMEALVRFRSEAGNAVGS